MRSTMTHLECSRHAPAALPSASLPSTALRASGTSGTSGCGKTYPHDKLQNLCTCGAPLLARYDLAAARRALGHGLVPTTGKESSEEMLRKVVRSILANRVASMWRYAELLPAGEPVTLGEGMTPLVHARRLGERLGLSQLYIKDEGLNPTGSFKARGLSAAVTAAKALGAKTLAIPTAGNAGGALAAYAARAGLRSVIVMPTDTPAANVQECRAFGADVRKIDGLISDCGRYVAEHKEREGWFDVSTLKEPYRVEGKKTMGYELWEQCGGWNLTSVPTTAVGTGGGGNLTSVPTTAVGTGRELQPLPEVIIYPTGGGVGLIGMWKAFEEMQAMGWIGSERPRMVVVQAAGCAPVVRAFEQGSAAAEFWPDAATIASGLRVPKPLGDALILEALRASRGIAVAASDEEMLAAGRELAAMEGMFAAPEGAATVVAARKLVEQKWIAPGEKVVLFNTGTGYKYSEAWERALQM